MVSTPTARLRLELQAQGDNLQSWGDVANAIFSRIEEAIAGETAISTTGGTTTLTVSNYVADQARMSRIYVTGTLVSNAIIVVPAVQKEYTIINATSGSFSLTVKTASVAGITIAQGAAQSVYVRSDGTVGYASVAVSAAGGILDGIVTTAKIVDANVTTAKIADAGITTAKVADDAITNAKAANMAAYTFKGNNTNATADPVDMTVDQAVANLAQATVATTSMKSLTTKQNLSYNTVTNGSTSGTITIDASAGPQHLINIAGTITLGTFSNAQVGAPLLIRIANASGATRTIGYSNVNGGGLTLPTSVANAKSIVLSGFMVDATNFWVLSVNTL